MASSRAVTLSAKDKALLREVKRLILLHVPGARVLLYGSVARGEATPESDYDVLVITPRKLSTAEERSVHDAVYAVELERNAVVSIMFYSQEEWKMPLVVASPYYENVLRESLPL